MRMPPAARVGIVALIVGLAASIGSGYWLASRNWVPVNIPIKLAKGHIHSGNFRVNLRGEYVASVDLDEPAEDSCLEYRALQVRWELSRGGGVIDQSASDLSDYFESEDGTFDIDLEVLSDASCLNARNPRLVVALSPYGPSDTADQITNISILLGISIMCAGAGIVLLTRARSRSEDECRRANCVTPFLPHPWSNVAFVGEHSDSHETAFAYTTFRRRNFPRRQITPNLPTIGYAYATTWLLIFVPLALVFMGWQQRPVGLPVSVVRLDASDVKNDFAFEPLLVRVELGHHLYLNAQPITSEELSRTLGERLARRPYWYVYVDADPNVQFADVARAVDIIRGQHADAVLVTPRTMQMRGAK
jgi:biopolymer transport protein ExbD